MEIREQVRIYSRNLRREREGGRTKRPGGTSRKVALNLQVWIYQDQKWVVELQEALKDRSISIDEDKDLQEIVRLYLQFLEMVKQNPYAETYIHPDVIIDVMVRPYAARIK